MTMELRGGSVGAGCAKTPVESSNARTKARAWRTGIEAFMNTFGCEHKMRSGVLCGSAPNRQAAEGTDCHRSPCAAASRPLHVGEADRLCKSIRPQHDLDGGALVLGVSRPHAPPEHGKGA